MLLADALAAHKHIVVVADYDCDGASACAVALRGLALLGESLKPVQWLGAALALVSVALINRRRQLWEPQP